MRAPIRRRKPIWTTGVPMKRRLAYKIYNHMEELNRICKKIDDFELANGEALAELDIDNKQQFLQLLRAAGLTDREIKFLVKRGQSYTRDQIRRSMQKVDRDLFNPKKKPHLWNRYKVGPRYRRTSEFHAKMQFLRANLDELTTAVVTMSNQIGYPSPPDEVVEASLVVEQPSDKLLAEVGAP